VYTSELSGSIGVRVDGLDLEVAATEETQDKLRRLLAAHHLLLFRAEALSAEGHIGLLSCFGRVLDERGDGARHVFVSNNRPDGVLCLGRRLLFHSDCTRPDVRRAPPSATRSACWGRFPPFPARC
jgi:hypothetical protein